MSMKILHSINSLNPDTGGPARSVPGLANSLVNLGNYIGIWTEDGDQGEVGSFDFEFIPGGSDLCRETFIKFDLIHDHGLWLSNNHMIAKLSGESEIPRIVSPRGMLEPWAINHKKWKKRIAWWLYQKRDLKDVACLHATSRAEAMQFRSLGLNCPIAVIPNGVEIPTFYGHPKVDSNTNRKRAILFLSRIQKKKGLLNLVAAWQHVRDPNWHIRVVGPEEDGYLADVKKAALRAGVLDDFSFEQPVDGDEKWRLMQSADLFVLPSYSENFGIVIAEALGCGVPVVTTKGTPWAELQSEECGWWIDIGGDPLATALLEAMNLTDEQRIEMGERGRLLVREKYAWASIGEQMQSVYKWILNGGSQPDCVV